MSKLILVVIDHRTTAQQALDVVCILPPKP